jgi:2-keto-4-pentenoate hydratase
VANGSDERIAAGMRRQLATRDAALEAGAARRGWKVAFATPQSQVAAGVDRSVVGFLIDATELPDGAEVAVDGWTKPTVEAELAIHVGDDLGVAAVSAAIEVVDPDLPVDRTEDVLAGDVFHRHYVLTPPDAARRGGDVADVRIRAFVDGELVAAQDDPCSVVGLLPNIVATVAAELARHGEQLQPGDLILGGSTTGMHPVTAGQRLRVEADGLGALELSFR